MHNFEVRMPKSDLIQPNCFVQQAAENVGIVLSRPGAAACEGLGAGGTSRSAGWASQISPPFLPKKDREISKNIRRPQNLNADAKRRKSSCRENDWKPNQEVNCCAASRGQQQDEDH